MTKKKLIILVIGFFLIFSGWQSVKGFQEKGIEKAYKDLGYKSVSKAIQETESYYKTNLDLPNKLPPLDFTHSFGRLNRENEVLEIEYLNVGKHFNYIINIIPAKEELKLFSSKDKIPLKDGTQAAYYRTSRTNGNNLMTFMFKNNNWIYILSIEEGLIVNPLSTLVEIANSL